MSKGRNIRAYFRNKWRLFCLLSFKYFRRAKRAALKIVEHHSRKIFHSFSWSIFSYLTYLDQSRKSDNAWWIIIDHTHVIAIHFSLGISNTGDSDFPHFPTPRTSSTLKHHISNSLNVWNCGKMVSCNLYITYLPIFWQWVTSSTRRRNLL